MNRILATLVVAALLQACGGGSDNMDNCPASGCVGPFSTRYFAYVVNSPTGAGSVSAFTIAAATGALTAAPGSPFTATTTSNAVAADAAGRFVYVANAGSNNIS